ncbi:MAG TPA: nuclear transport factor 2 family protein [Xanthomonadales bacterium]|nr:nuclear transport factor 2 family protein [Xanthomonadales bacterium]
MGRTIACAAVLAALAWSGAAPAEDTPKPAIPDAPALAEQVHAADAKLFEILFERCEPDALRALLADDLEFYHDKDGFIEGAETLVSGYAKRCEAAKAPGAWRSRRELVASTSIVDAIPGVGAIHAGEHRFHERRGDGPEKLVGRARFANLWTLTPGGWKLARVFSYDHGPAGTPE